MVSLRQDCVGRCQRGHKVMRFRAVYRFMSTCYEWFGVLHSKCQCYVQKCICRYITCAILFATVTVAEAVDFFSVCVRSCGISAIQQHEHTTHFKSHRLQVRSAAQLSQHRSQRLQLRTRRVWRCHTRRGGWPKWVGVACGRWGGGSIEKYFELYLK